MAAAPGDVVPAVKLVDFGFAKAVGVDSPANTMLGTPWYTPPEVFRAGTAVANAAGGGLPAPYCGMKADIWSLGVMLLVMVSHAYPFKATGDLHAFCRNLAITGQLRNTLLEQLQAVAAHVSPACVDFMHACFAEDPAARPSAAELLDHPWVKAGEPYAHVVRDGRCAAAAAWRSVRA